MLENKEQNPDEVLALIAPDTAANFDFCALMNAYKIVSLTDNFFLLAETLYKNGCNALEARKALYMNDNKYVPYCKSIIIANDDLCYFGYKGTHPLVQLKKLHIMGLFYIIQNHANEAIKFIDEACKNYMQKKFLLKERMLEFIETFASPEDREKIYTQALDQNTLWGKFFFYKRGFRTCKLGSGILLEIANKLQILKNTAVTNSQVSVEIGFQIENNTPDDAISTSLKDTVLK